MVIVVLANQKKKIFICNRRWINQMNTDVKEQQDMWLIQKT